MVDDQFEQKLRVALLEDAPGPVPARLRLRIASIPDESAASHLRLVRSPLTGRLRAVAAGLAAVIVVGGTIIALAGLHNWGVRPASPSLPRLTLPSTAVSPAPSAASSPTSSPAASAPACTAPQLAIGDVAWQGATGSMMGGFVVWNTSDTPCMLVGTPRVDVLDASGRDLHVANHPMPSAAPSAFTLPAHQPAPVLFRPPPAGLGSVEVQWWNMCGTVADGPLSVVVTLPAGGVLRSEVGYGGEPPCVTPSGGSVMIVGPFQRIPGPGASQLPAGATPAG